MKTKLKKIISDDYFTLLRNLDISDKLKIISELSNSMLMDIKEREKKFNLSFGSFKSDDTPEKIINDIKKSRYFDNKRIDL